MDRPKCEYRNLSAKFLLKKREYLQQYSQVYFIRKQTLSIILKTAVQEMFPESSLVDDIQEAELTSESAVMIGTVYKDMVLKPSVLRELLEELSIQTPAQCFLSDSDTVILESDSRIPLAFEKDNKALLPEINKITTGIVVAVRGRKSDCGGSFIVEEWLSLDVPVKIPGFVNPQMNLLPDEPLVAIVSGLGIGSSCEINSLALRSLQFFLLGHTNLKTQKDDAKTLDERIIRVLVIGDTLGVAIKEADKENKAKEAASSTDSPIASTALVMTQGNVEETIGEVDTFFHHIAQILPVDIVPGPGDPTTCSIPQQPLPPVFFPSCRDIRTFQSVPNPYFFEVDGVRILAASGQPVRDIREYTDFSKDIDCLEYCVRNRHIAPTAPDTLPCYPFVTSDPLILEEKEFPQIIISGLSTEPYQTKLISNSRINGGNSVRILTLPRFTLNPSLILLGVKSLAVSQILL